MRNTLLSLIAIVCLVESATAGDYYLAVFSASWCRPCRDYHNSAEYTRIKSTYKIREIDTDQDKRWGVGSIPAVWLCRDSKVVKKWTGPTSLATIEAAVPSESPAVTTRQVLRQVQSQAVYGGRTYSGRVCSNPRCSMCNQIQAQLQPVWVTETVEVPAIKTTDAGMEPSSPELIATMLEFMRLTSDDVLADPGCGDGRILIAAAQRCGCRCVGVEIVPEKAAEARANVERSGLSGQILILNADAREFDFQRYGVTAVAVYLYPDLLAILAPELSGVRVVASAYHEVPGLDMRRVGDVWVTR